MAKKNSTKTATKEAMQASIPKVQALQGWQGVNFELAPPNWDQDAEHRTDDLQNNFFLVQNNIVSTSNGTIETRPESVILCEAPEGVKFTGVAYEYVDTIFAAFDDNSLRYWKIDQSSEWKTVKVCYWHEHAGEYVKVYDENGILPEHLFGKWSNIYTYGVNYTDMIICQTSGIAEDNWDEHASNMFTLALDKLDDGYLINAPRIDEPAIKATVVQHGPILSTEADDELVSQETIMYTYMNRYGMTGFDKDPTGHLVLNCIEGPATWNMEKYVSLTVSNIPLDQDITAVAFYDCEDESTDPIFIGMVEAKDFIDDTATLDWYGAMANTDEWENANLSPNGVNTTRGCVSAYCRQHDGRIYCWGNPCKPYRLGILGNPKSELNYAIGMGAGFMDIEPGTGLEITATQKFKTASGASIVTILCHHPNTSRNKRFNLIESNITLTNEISMQSWQTEEVSNVIGSNSVWGSGVWEDGLYCLGRYGLGVTTMAMEYNAQLKTQYISQNIDPVFEENLGNMINNARMIHVKDISYFIFADPEDDCLEHVLFCYDHSLNLWYTFTYGNDDTVIKHLINVDFEGSNEGIGIICEDHFALIPMAGPSRYFWEKAIKTPQYYAWKQAEEYKNVMLEELEPVIAAKKAHDRSNALLDIEHKKPWSPDKFVPQNIFDTYGSSTQYKNFMHSPTNTQFQDNIRELINNYDLNEQTAFEMTAPYKAFKAQGELNLESLIETGEIGTSTPPATTAYVAQLEFRFDYLWGEVWIDLDGVDYYGRKVHVHKHIIRKNMDYGVVDWMRVNLNLENWHLTIRSKAHFRLDAILIKQYAQSASINLPYGFDASSAYKNRINGHSYVRHYIRNYNNLKDAIVT